MRFFALSTLDPRSKVMMMISLSTTILFTENLWIQIGALALTFMTLLLGGISMNRMWKQLRGIFVVLLFLFLIQSICVRGGETLVGIGSFSLVTERGFHLGCVLCLRFFTILLAALILLTGEPRTYLLAMIQCKMPYELAFMVMTGVHFLPLLRDEAMNVYYAIQLRGTEMEQAKWREKLGVYRRICLPILTGALRRSRTMATSMELRGLRAKPERTYMNRLRMSGRDWLFLLVYPAFATGAMLLLAS